MKKLLGIVVLGLLWCNITLASEFYLVCLNVMVDDRSPIKLFTNEKKEIGFQYFKFDKTNYEITIHEQIFVKKPSRVGSIKINYDGKKIIEFEIKDKGSVDSYKLMNTIDLSLMNSIDLSLIEYNWWENFKFESSVYLKTESSIYDYDFKSTSCIPPMKKGEVLKPSKAKKLYKKWIRKGY